MTEIITTIFIYRTIQNIILTGFYRKTWEKSNNFLNFLIELVFVLISWLIIDIIIFHDVTNEFGKEV